MTVSAIRKTSKAEALAQLAERPDLAANVSAAARLWGVSRSTARAWIADAGMAVPSEPPPAAMAEPSPVPPSPVVAAMVKPSHDFRNLFPPNPGETLAATMVDERRAMAVLEESASAAMAAPVDTLSSAMATSMVEKPAGVPVPVKPFEWHIVQRPAWRPIVLSLDVQPPAHPAHPARRSLASILAAIMPASILVAAVLFLAALDLGGSGLVMNARYASSLGSGEGATIQAAIGIAIDAIALVLLSAGYLLWSHGHRRFAVLAWIVWPVILGLSLMNTIGFSATHISDALAKRSAAVAKTSNAAIKASNTASDIKKWREERDAITEKRPVAVLEIQLVQDRKKVDLRDRDAFEATLGCRRLTPDTMKACDPVLPILKALETARRRDDLTKKISDAEKPQNGAPTADGNQKSTTTTTEGNQESTTTITSADPQTETIPKLVTWITRGWIEPTPDDIALVRVLGFTVPPALAGLFLMIATALLAAPRTASAARS
jgi:hypothetical protein